MTKAEAYYKAMDFFNGADAVFSEFDNALDIAKVIDDEVVIHDVADCGPLDLIFDFSDGTHASY